jgi:hypothetical protein
MEAVVDKHGQREGNGGDGEQALEDGVHDHAVGIAQQPACPPEQVVGALCFTGQLPADKMDCTSGYCHTGRSELTAGRSVTTIGWHAQKYRLCRKKGVRAESPKTIIQIVSSELAQQAACQ